MQDVIFNHGGRRLMAYVDDDWMNDPKLNGLLCLTHETQARFFLLQIVSGGILAGATLRDTGAITSNKKRDDRNGGGWYVYTRIITTCSFARIGKGSIGSAIDPNNVMLVLDRKLIRRHDMWSSGTDLYGKTPKTDPKTNGMSRKGVLNTLRALTTSNPQQNESGFYQAIDFSALQKVLIKGVDKTAALETLREIVEDIHKERLDQRLTKLTGKKLHKLFSWGMKNELITTVIEEEKRVEGAATIVNEVIQKYRSRRS